MNDVRLLVKDDFLPNPEQVRQEALACPFGDFIGPDGGVYKHVQVRPVDEFSDEIAKVVGRPVKQSLTMIRANYAGENPHSWVHSDQICAEFASVFYLNLPEQCVGGTAFWKNKDTGWESLPTEISIRKRGKSPKREYARIEKNWRNPDSWEQSALVDMKFNRFIAYPSRRFHSRWPWAAVTGTTPENSRLIWVSFFDTVE